MANIDFLRALAIRDLICHLIMLLFVAFLAKALRKVHTRFTVQGMCSIWLLWVYWSCSKTEFRHDRQIAARVQEIEDKTFHQASLLWQTLRSPLEITNMADFFYDISVADDQLDSVYKDMEAREETVPERARVGGILSARQATINNFIQMWRAFCQNSKSLTTMMAQDAAVVQNAMAREIEYEHTPRDLAYYRNNPAPKRTPTGVESRCRYQDVPGISKRYDTPCYAAMLKVIWNLHANAETLYRGIMAIKHTLDHISFLDDEAAKYMFLHDHDTSASQASHFPSMKSTKDEWYMSLAYLRDNIAKLYTETRRLNQQFPLGAYETARTQPNLASLEEAMGYLESYDPLIAQQQADLIHRRMAKVAFGLSKK